MNESKKNFNLAMIGAGFIARAHSNAFRQVGHFFEVPYQLRCKVICARNQENLARMAAQWEWEETAADWQEVVERKDIDAIDIAVPNVLHAPIAQAAARAGKMVWCEKPLARSLAEAQVVAEAVRRVPNLVWFNYRRVPAVAYAKRLIDENRLGDIFHYRGLYLNQSGNDPKKTSGWRYRRADAGSGALGDLLSHSIEHALHLNGRIHSLSATMHTFAPGRDVDDAVLLLARFENGSLGTFEATRYAVGCRNRNAFEIHGSRGMLRFDLENMNRLEFVDATEPANLQAARNLMVTGPDQPYSDVFWKPGHQIGYEHSFIATLGDFLTAQACGETFHPGVDDAVEVQRILDGIERSAATGTWVTVADLT
jgi:myo-inositol 2-dehydrogenase/D-chiro-inositol 1-dehydrogenase